MGKYPNSDLHNKYSDWHYALVRQDEKYRRLYLADVDRLWIEYDFQRKAVVGVFDIKWDDSSDRGFTPTEKGIYEWFEEKGAPVYTVFITRDFQLFRIATSDGEVTLASQEYADWLLSLRTDKPVPMAISQLAFSVIRQ